MAGGSPISYLELHEGFSTIYIPSREAHCATIKFPDYDNTKSIIYYLKKITLDVRASFDYTFKMNVHVVYQCFTKHMFAINT